MKLYSTAEVRIMTGIQVTGDYKYELALLTLEDINLSGFTEDNMNKLSKSCEDMINHLKLGGTLSPIILYPRERDRKLSIADGCHRIYSYIITKTSSFYGLIKTS